MAEVVFPYGFYAAVTGTEGCGKTTQLGVLEDFFKNGVGEEWIVRTKEPGGTKLGSRIRGLLLASDLGMLPGAEFFLFAADRYQHIGEVVEPALSQRKIVLSDRSFRDTAAYQGYGRSLNHEFINMVRDWVIRRQHYDVYAWEERGRIARDYKPELTILFDLDPEIGLLRKQDQIEELSKFESELLPFHQRVREGLKQQVLEEPDAFITVDANQPVELVSKEMLQKLGEWMKEHSALQGRKRIFESSYISSVPEMIRNERPRLFELPAMMEF